MVLGIDPGVSGGLVFVDTNFIMSVKLPTRLIRVGSSTRRVIDTGDLIARMRIISVREAIYPDIIAMEKVSSMPGQGVASMFSFGKTCGTLEGVLRSTYPLSEYVEISPNLWKRYFNLIGTNKDASVRLAKEKGFELVYGDGEAEAFLIAQFVRETKAPR